MLLRLTMMRLLAEIIRHPPTRRSTVLLAVQVLIAWDAGRLWDKEEAYRKSDTVEKTSYRVVDGVLMSEIRAARDAIRIH